MDSAAGIAPLQLRPARQAFQNLAGHDDVVSDYMPGVALDPHHSARTVVEHDFNRDTVMGDYQAVRRKTVYGVLFRFHK
jgi:hypothetical protein